MTQSSPGLVTLFAAARRFEAVEGRRGPVRTRRMSLPLLMDDGGVKSLEVPSALEYPDQFSAVEFERLSRAYAEALALLSPTVNT
jgi:hypothetical protein